MTTLLTPVHEPFIPQTRNERAQTSPADDLFRADLAQAKQAVEPPRRSELADAGEHNEIDDGGDRETIEADRDDNRASDAEKSDRDDRDSSTDADRADGRSEQPVAHQAATPETSQPPQPAVTPRGVEGQADAGQTTIERADDGSQRGQPSQPPVDPGVIREGAAQGEQPAAPANRNAAADASATSPTGDASKTVNQFSQASQTARTGQPATGAVAADQAAQAVAQPNQPNETRTASGAPAEPTEDAVRPQTAAQSDARLQREQARASDQQIRQEHQQQRADANADRPQATTAPAEPSARQTSPWQRGVVNHASPMQSSDAGGDSGRQFMNMVAQADGRGNAVVMPAAARAQTIETKLSLERSAPSGARIADGAATTIGAAPLGAGANGGGSTSLSSGLLSDGDAAGATSPSATAKEASFAQRVMRGLHAMINQKGGVMNMRLDPPELGSMRIQMVLQQGTVSAQFNVSTDQAQQLLNRNLNALKSALEARGLTVERLTVATTQASDNASASRSDNGAGNSAQQQQAGSQQDAGQGMSRGRSDGGEQQRQGASHESRASRSQSFTEAFEPFRPSASE
jgi:flagellar hook-length control protein FliK